MNINTQLLEPVEPETTETEADRLGQNARIIQDGMLQMQSAALCMAMKRRLYFKSYQTSSAIKCVP